MGTLNRQLGKHDLRVRTGGGRLATIFIMSGSAHWLCMCISSVYSPNESGINLTLN